MEAPFAKYPSELAFFGQNSSFESMPGYAFADDEDVALFQPILNGFNGPQKNEAQQIFAVTHINDMSSPEALDALNASPATSISDLESLLSVWGSDAIAAITMPGAHVLDMSAQVMVANDLSQVGLDFQPPPSQFDSILIPSNGTQQASSTFSQAKSAPADWNSPDQFYAKGVQSVAPISPPHSPWDPNLMTPPVSPSILGTDAGEKAGTSDFMLSDEEDSEDDQPLDRSANGSLSGMETLKGASPSSGKPKKKRRRKTTAELSAPELEARRLKNSEAARRCRLRKACKLKVLEDRVRELETINSSLEQKCKLLEMKLKSRA